MKCHYNKKVICDYLDQSGDIIVYECFTCAHYNPQREEDDLPVRYMWGCLILSSIGFAVLLIVAHFIIKALRP